MFPSATPRKKKSTRRSLSAKPSFRYRISHSSYKYLSNTDELELMSQNECQQCMVDRFWGIDKEISIRDRELQLMALEDGWSDKLSKISLIRVKQIEWEREYDNFYRNSHSGSISQDSYCSSYLNQFYNNLINREIMENNEYEYNSYNLFQLFPQIDGSNERLSSPHQINEELNSSPVIHRNLSSRARSSDSVQLRSRINSSGNGSSSSSRQRSRLGLPIVNQDIEDKMRKYIFQEFISSSNMNKNSDHGRNNNPSHQSKQFDSSSSSSNVDILQGHPIYKWNQESILRVVYNTLRSGSLLTIFDVKKISRKIDIQYLLKFTVFGAYIKKKNWDVFQGLFLDSETITLDDWIASAKRLSIDKNVETNWIRSYEEHKQYAEMFSDSKNNNKISRNTFQMKSIRLDFNFLYEKNDCVWAMHNKAGLWLPAIIEDVFYNENDNTTFCLKYPLQQKEYEHALETMIQRKRKKMPIKSVMMTTNSSTNSNIRTQIQQLWKDLFPNTILVSIEEFENLLNFNENIQVKQLMKLKHFQSVCKKSIEKLTSIQCDDLIAFVTIAIDLELFSN